MSMHDKRILKFSADWCGPCKQLNKVLKDAVLSVPIENIDVDEGYEMSRRYGVRAVPTLILLQCEKEVGRLNGAKTVAEIQEWVDQH